MNCIPTVIQIYCYSVHKNQVVTSAYFLNCILSLHNVTALLKSVCPQYRTPNTLLNWVTQSTECHNRLNDDNFSHTRGPGTRNLIVICFKNSHSLAATGAPVTYNCMSWDLKHHFILLRVYKLHLSCSYIFPKEFTSKHVIPAFFFSNLHRA